MDKEAGGRPAHASPQISDKRDDREAHSGPTGSGAIRVHRDFPNRDMQENVHLKEEMKRERMLITVSQEPVALSKLAVDQVKDKTVGVGSKDSRKNADKDRVEDGKSSKEDGKKAQAKSSKSAKKLLGKKLHKAKKKKKSKKKKDKKKS